MHQSKRDFDKESFKWDENPGRVKLAGDVADAITKTIKITPDMDVLDYGCGTGLLTLLLQPRVHHITGLDSSKGMLDILNKKLQQYSLANITTKRFDLEKGDSLDSRYDLITCNMTLHHAEDPAFLIKQLCNGLRSGGYLCITDLDPDKGEFHGDNQGVFHFGFERSLMYELFIQAGLADVHCTTAATLTKKTGREEMRTFSIFLAIGKKQD
jgi:2-polyprenyl-3-methyl-5-hydroxy-6-metoxy-1,4-benzoquinol methylase